MSEFKKTSVFPRQSSYNSLYANPLSELRHNRSSSEGGNSGNNIVPLAVHIRRNLNPANVPSDDKENFTPNRTQIGCWNDKENAGFCKGIRLDPGDFVPNCPNLNTKDRALKPSSLQLCMKKHEPDSIIGTRTLEPVDSGTTNSGNIWDYSDSEAAPASSWSTLPNRSLLCRPLPVDIGRCTCLIVKEPSPEGLDKGTLYSLYTHEGHGRQNRKLAVAHHRRRNGRSEFLVASCVKGLVSGQDDSLIGNMTANLMGSKYHLWGQGNQLNPLTKLFKLLAVVTFTPTITTWTGSHRSIKAWIPKHQSMQLKNVTQHINGLPLDWKEKMDKVHQLFSRVPHYNKVNISKKYELDYRDRGRTGLRIQSSVKNFQLTLEKNGRQTILQLGRVGKSNYVMDFRYPMTGFQAFCISLASIDSKACCTM
ncbi:tubby-like protein 8 isoform X3 [Coffea arabica]|uniref:Tubby-like protein 8 isoform X3 n=1 Tax=Coffea arabica TaxID=13443 RepID=A0A6P6XF44_COFAR|nr:tubby-like protein 8 isoform X3 [Coffea arabica]XP_027124632.1 tubby-like protein 8 isoform X3 [Coffea arabica]